MKAGKDGLSEEEIAERRDLAIRRALTTPPQPAKAFVGKAARDLAKRGPKAARKVQAKSKDA